MTRITNERLAELADIADTHSGGIQLSRATAALVFDELKERRAVDHIREAEITELVARRSDDLTSFERTVLETVRDDIAEYEHHDVNVVRILDKILARRGDK